MSESAPVLAGDLALCHPKLRPGEVRAVARPLQGSTAVRLTVVATDRAGLLADSAAVLASSGLPISHASASTWDRQRLALHSFVVDGGAHLDEARWAELGERLRTMAASGSAPTPMVGSPRPLRITVRGGREGDRSMVTITGPDHLGLLSLLCRAFASMDANIESLDARTADGIAKDTFLVAGPVDATMLGRLLGHRRPAGRASRPAVAVGASPPTR